MNDYTDILFRWLHILPAIALVGGTFFMRFALVPSLASIDEATREQLAESVRARWAKWVMAGSGLLLLSGLYNAARVSIQYQLSPTYNGLLLVKILLALVVFYLAAVLTGRSESARRFQQQRQKWLTINLLLAVTIVCIAGVMRFLPREEKVREASRVFQPVAVVAVVTMPTAEVARG
ncbi:MAG: hypothetical protein KDA62_14845 [Planctomycetales bacterium]|nr:hypothetical protein [Planctomycetales bacterium]MCA9164264.1 hypothetical protein [Planctomycetales bacterium]MCA9226772.1 hypothetical protein [Planctomycetales bacterium]